MKNIGRFELLYSALNGYFDREVGLTNKLMAISENRARPGEAGVSRSYIKAKRNEMEMEIEKT